MSNKSPKIVLEETTNCIKTEAWYTAKPWLAIYTIGGPYLIEVSCRDFNKALTESPGLLNIYETMIYYQFFDKIFAKMDVNGVLVNVQSSEPVNLTPRYFLPDRGRAYTMDELQGKTDTHSEGLKYSMKQSNVTSCYVDGSRRTAPMSFEKGDRILDKSEITVVIPKKGAISREDPSIGEGFGSTNGPPGFKKLN